MGFRHPRTARDRPDPMIAVRLEKSKRNRKFPKSFAVGEPVTNVQAPKAKGHRSRALSAFELPDHGFYKGSLRGRTANIFTLNLIRGVELDPS